MNLPKIGVFGSGNWGQKIVLKLLELGCPHVVCGTANRAMLEQRGVKFINQDGYKDSEAILRLIDQSDAVVVATPPLSHFELIEKSITRNKDVFAEKPITIASSAALQLAELAKNYGRILMVGHIFCFSPHVQKNLLRLTNNVIGVKIVYLKKTTKEPLLNATWNLATHFLALIDKMQISHEKIQLIVDDHAQTEQRAITVTLPDGSEVTVDFLSPQITQEDILKIELLHFINCVQTRQTPLTDGYHAARVIKMLEYFSPQYSK